MNQFENRKDASRAAAQQIETAMKQALDKRSPSTLIVSGGSSPAMTLEMLSTAPLDWANIQVMLTDERLVDIADERSNEKMVREKLMRGNAASARFRKLQPGTLDDVIAGCALVGMGEDGHFASLFPDLHDLDALLSMSAAPAACNIRTKASDVGRISMNLAALTRSELIVLLAFGDAKRQIIDNPTGYPVEALFNQTKTPVATYWAT